MGSDEPVVEAMAILGAIFWSIQLLPQIYLNYRRGHTTGLHQGMMILWSVAGIPLGIHNILSQQHIALQVQAQILTFFSLLTWAQVVYYSHRWSKLKTLSALTGLTISFGAIEAAVVVGFMKGSSDGRAPHSFILAMAILSAVCLALGVLRHYIDIYSERSVRGISWGFVFLDAAGDLTSLLAVDIVAAGIYASELALWIGIMIAGCAFNLFHLDRRLRAGQRNDISGIGDANDSNTQIPCTSGP